MNRLKRVAHLFCEIRIGKRPADGFLMCFLGLSPPSLPPSLPVGCGSLRGAAQSAVWLREPHRPAHCAGASRGHEPHLDHAQSKAGEKRDETGRVSIAGSPCVCLKMGSNGGDPDIDH